MKLNFYESIKTCVLFDGSDFHCLHSRQANQIICSLLHSQELSKCQDVTITNQQFKQE